MNDFTWATAQLKAGKKIRCKSWASHCHVFQKANQVAHIQWHEAALPTGYSPTSKDKLANDWEHYVEKSK